MELTAADGIIQAIGPIDTRLLARGILLGIGAAVPIGPVNVQIARRALRDGFPSGFALGCGAVTVDVAYAVVSSLSFSRLLTQPLVARVVGVAGVVLLTYLGLLCFRAAWRALKADPIAAEVAAPPPRQSLPSAYVTGLLMTLFNPMTLAFWFTVVPDQIPKDRPGNLPMICAGVFIGTVSWVVAFAGLLGWAGRYRRKWWMAMADAIGGAILLAFAVLGFLRLRGAFL